MNKALRSTCFRRRECPLASTESNKVSRPVTVMSCLLVLLISKNGSHEKTPSLVTEENAGVSAQRNDTETPEGGWMYGKSSYNFFGKSRTSVRNVRTVTPMAT